MWDKRLQATTAALLVMLVGLQVVSQVCVNAGTLRLVSNLVPGTETPAIYEAVLSGMDKAILLCKSNDRAYYWRGFAFYKLGCLSEAIDAWHSAGLTRGEYFTNNGNSSLKAGMTNAAWMWYTMALTLDPSWSDAWYHIGEMYCEAGEWDAAILAMRYSIDKDNFVEIGKSDAYMKLGVTYEKTQMPDMALKMYKTALLLNQFTASRLKADALYREGDLLRRQGYAPNQYIKYFRRALSIAPYHHWARLRLGIATYQMWGDVSLSERYIKTAISWWPPGSSQKWPFLYAGQIYWDTGLLTKARYAYLMALRIDPTEQTASEGLIATERELDSLLRGNK